MKNVFRLLIVLLFSLCTMISCNSSDSGNQENGQNSNVDDDDSGKTPSIPEDPEPGEPGNPEDPEIPEDPEPGATFTPEQYFRKLKKLDSFSANVQNASSLGLVKKDSKPNKKDNKNTSSSDYETTYTMVKTTSDYDQVDPEINIDGTTIDVVFTRIDTTVTTTNTVGQKTLIASLKPDDNDDVIIIEYGSESISFETNQKHKYRIIDDKNRVVCDWFKAESATTTIENLSIDGEKISSRNCIVEAKSLDATVSYSAYDGFKYSLLDSDENLLIDSVDINSSLNVAVSSSVIAFDGLVEGERYILKYSGTGVEEVVEQTKIGGEIDKMFVYDSRFTFISFVPYGESNRPSEKDMIYDTNGISIYDKTDYYSDSKHLSFVVDNYSGLIYLIENFHIRGFSNGLILKKGDNLIYDFKINDDNDLVFYALYNNEQITWFNFFKDEKGNKVVQNDKINTYDKETNTYYYTERRNKDIVVSILTFGKYKTEDERYSSDDPFFYYDEDAKKYMDRPYNWETIPVAQKMYYLTSDNRTLCVEIENYTGVEGHTPSCKNAYIIANNNKCQEIQISDSFYTIDPYWFYFKISYGYICLIDKNNNYFDRTYKNDRLFIIYDCENMNPNAIWVVNDKNENDSNSYITWYDGTFWVYYEYIKKYNIVLFYSEKDNKLFSISFEDVLENLKSEEPNSDGYVSITSEYRKLVLEDANMGDDRLTFLKYGINGTITYDVVVEEIDGHFVVNSYVAGTYEAPNNVVVLHPINR